MRDMVRIPISAARDVADRYGYDQVVIYARRCHDSPEPHGEHLTTYGRTREHGRRPQEVHGVGGMNGWTLATVFLILWVGTVDPIRSQISCYVGVQPACLHLEKDYR